MIRGFLLASLCLIPLTQAPATTAIALRSRYRVVLAADSRAVYGAGHTAAECKIFEYRNVYATVSGLAHYGGGYRSTDAIRDGYARPGTFQQHVEATASSLQSRTQSLLAYLERNNPSEYRRLTQNNGKSDFVALAIAEVVAGQPMLGVIELQRSGSGPHLATHTSICPGNCRQGDGLFYLGYWDQIRPYVANDGQQRTVGSAASLDRLIRLEMNAHPDQVGAPINILELGDSGPRWLQNGGNCSLPGVGW